MGFPLPRLDRAIISCSRSRQTKVMYRFQWMCRLRRKWLMRSESATPEPRLDSEQGEKKKRGKRLRPYLASNNKSAKPPRMSNTTSESATTSLSSSTRRPEVTDTSLARRLLDRAGYPCRLKAAPAPRLAKEASQQVALPAPGIPAILPTNGAIKDLPSPIAMSVGARARTFLLPVLHLVSKPSLRWDTRSLPIRPWLLRHPPPDLAHPLVRCSMARHSPNNKRAIPLLTHLSAPTGAGLLNRPLGAVRRCRLQDSTNRLIVDSLVTMVEDPYPTYEIF
ncbi:hypothetical protein MPH_13166 [Macrophomina phaseolina MS6]|uniref:Uncharacterized protein n=1 Tax=Macrophomina phaseolina (strain MS6) TaxID=1126212 RepID=K2R6B9_MACPH|nr:hypothetical protein MPH_13166 [Macrophomina phaseolina MS6]